MTDPIITLWTAQQAGATAPSRAQLAERAARLRRRLRTRDLIEYAAGALVIAIFGYIAIDASDWGVCIASLTLIAGTCIVLRNLWHRRPANDPATLGQDALTHYRGLLSAQHQALASVGRWYLAPFLPGMTVFIAAAVRAQAEAIPLAAALRNGAVATVVIALIFGGIFWLNRSAARAIALEIATLGADPAID